MWSVAQAKAHLSEIMRRARAGEPQKIGAQDACVLISGECFHESFENREHDGLFLLHQAARLGADIETPTRGADRAPPFTDA